MSVSYEDAYQRNEAPVRRRRSLPCIRIILGKAIWDPSCPIKTVLRILKDVNSYACCAKLFSENNPGSTSHRVRNCVGGTLQNNERCIRLPRALADTAKCIAQGASGSSPQRWDLPKRILTILLCIALTNLLTGFATKYRADRSFELKHFGSGHGRHGLFHPSCTAGAVRSRTNICCYSLRTERLKRFPKMPIKNATPTAVNSTCVRGQL